LKLAGDGDLPSKILGWPIDRRHVGLACDIHFVTPATGEGSGVYAVSRRAASASELLSGGPEDDFVDADVFGFGDRVGDKPGKRFGSPALALLIDALRYRTP
jgi:hypothetical protein